MPSRRALFRAIFNLGVMFHAQLHGSRKWDRLVAARILLVEDDATNRTLARRILDARGFDVSEAIDGQEALNALRAWIPDILLLDLSLPQVDGWTVTRRLRQDAQYENLWIIAVTAHAMAGDRERALEAGCNDYLAKPYRPAELIASIAHGLNESLRGVAS
jgi:two-component system cell cycle response regulator DivK